MNRLFQNNDIIGDYRIDGYLGAGGMGEVYRGVHLQLHRVAAVKVLSSLTPNNSLATRFHNEARVQSSLHHPNIATLYDFKNVNGKLCIFMEYIDGECLEELIKRRYFAIEDALILFQKVCEAIAFIHKNGILHRDIKSQNIKINSAGTVKLLDFGIAKDATSQKLTQTGGVIGTPSYIAPEQLEGSPADVQTEVWALGVLFYEMLTGVQPFKAETIGGLCKKIANAEYESVEIKNPAVPRDLASIVSQCLKKNPNQRFRTVEELAATAGEALRSRYGIAVGSANLQYKLPPAYQLQDPFPDAARPVRKRSPLIPIFAGGVFAALLVAGVIGIGLLAMSSKPEIVKNPKGDITNENALFPTPQARKPERQFQLQSVADGESVNIQIEVIEGKAEVVRNGSVVGSTPYTLNLRIGEKADIKLRRDGYKDYETQIEGSSGKKLYTFALQKK